jgi:serine/threonine protein phosphatase 1
MNKFVLTDIHGCLKTFEEMIKKIDLSMDDKLFILGDLIDRGPNSKGVIDYIWKLKHEGYDVECVIGNHDQMMLYAYQSMNWQGKWLYNGGWTTIESFQVNTLNDIPLQYFDFIRNMHYFIEVDDYILVHAGINFKNELPLDDTNAMLWIRNWYKDINYEWLNQRIIIHGHTPGSKTAVSEMHNLIEDNQYLNLDTGCVYKGKKEGLGYLACFNLTSKELIFQENIDW